MIFKPHLNMIAELRIIEMKESIVKLTQDLVKVDSTKGKSINASQILYDFLEDHGLSATLDNYKEGEANVFCELGPADKPAVLISGHLDTVPIGDPNSWTHDPYSAKIVDGELWGRGSVDMKGGTAALAGVMVELLEHEDNMQQRVFFAATAEEETGLAGARVYIDKGQLPDLSHILIAEPTDLQPMVREKGIMWLDIHATGKQSHASRPDLGHNAIEGLARIFPKLYGALPDLSMPDLGRTSLNVGMIKGGSAPNVVPETATTTIDIRTTPGVDNNEVIDNIQSILRTQSGDVRFELDIIENVGAVLSPSDNFGQALANKTGEFTSEQPELGGVHYATDGAIFMEAVDNSVPFVIYGPGSTELLHQTNERLDLEQLNISRKVIRDVLVDITT